MEYSITKQEYERIRTLLYDESGISLGDTKQSLLSLIHISEPTRPY